ncbi:MAG: peptidylprolyl isomerase [Saprospiraceae bacterium]|nr:peptidylprolyl isomerase [Saprospiraceae bacterium]
MRNIVNRYVFWLAILSWAGCIPKTDTPKTIVNKSLSDKEIQKIYNFMATSDTDSLCFYLRHKDPSFRYHSLLLLSSLRDKNTLDSITPLLSDPILDVRALAAYTIGQLGVEKGALKLLSAFRNKDTISVNNQFNANILEAIGKTGNLSMLKSLASVKTYRVTDTLLISGQIKAIYHFMLRNRTAPEGSITALNILKEKRHIPEIRLYAAHYFGRGKNTEVEKYGAALLAVLNSTTEPEIRLPLITAIGKSKDISVLNSLKALLSTSQDYRVKVNVIKALGNFPYDTVRMEVAAFLKDKNHQISVTASQFFLDNGIKEDLEFYRLQIQDSLFWKSKANLYGCLLKHAPVYTTKFKTAVSLEIKSLIEKSSNVYEKAQLVKALSLDPYNYLLLDQYINSNQAPVKVAAAEGYKNILTSPNFFKAFGYGYPKIKAQILESLAAMILKNDVGTLAVAAQILREPSLGWREWIKDPGFLKEALKKIKLPEGIEAYNELDETLHFLEGKDYVRKPVEKHQPVFWELLNNTTDSSSVAVKTNKGTFRIRLHKNLAPYAVSNLLNLIEKKYYQQKIIHRVEPNFVIQTGCPRGDGNGSLDFTIPSELSSGNYNTSGLVGMASAGNHTECSQWFVTHSSAPHLDGNYTIFGHITEGMEVVNGLDVGDKIIEIIFIK